MDYSPALSVNSDMTDEELDKYFANYVPLSNLPTPPPTKDAIRNTTSMATTKSTSPSLQTTHETFSPKLQERQATHLANLVPSAHRPHVHVIRGFLERANLPDEVIAFAACVLDALSARFAASWREELIPAELDRDLKDFLRTDSQRHAHVSADVIVLAALALAHGFLIDRLRSSRHWSIRESAGVFSVKEIEATKRAILRDVDYGLARITKKMVDTMSQDMQKPKTTTSSLVRESLGCSKAARRRTLSINLSGTAIWSHGVQTPEPSP